ncbi:hypothetical protein SAMN05216316_0909 [Nitrosovibrio sp. Nv6]|nr:hypothetical protein SAMN05216316_0909 [Nitrosovibrio sp. Nv6]
MGKSSSNLKGMVAGAYTRGVLRGEAFTGFERKICGVVKEIWEIYQLMRMGSKE